MNYDCSVIKGRKGCNYCLHYKPIDIDDFIIRVDDESQTLDIEHYSGRADCCMKVNYCPICGKQLRKELL